MRLVEWKFGENSGSGQVVILLSTSCESLQQVQNNVGQVELLWFESTGLSVKGLTGIDQI